MSELEKYILRTITYYDIFRYPLTEDEIYFFLGCATTRNRLQSSLAELCQNGLLYHSREFFGLRNDPALMERRRRGNQQAARLLQTGRRICRFLYNFPFVRGVAISGSLSKNFAEEKSDIDYFIITSTDRVWIARTLLHAFKKISFLSGKQHHYCMNYFVDEAALEIEEQNIFTAVELATLMPVCGNRCVKNFFKANDWILEKFPNHPGDKRTLYENPSRPRLQRFFESLFNNRFGNWLEQYFMELTTARWKKKEKRKKLNLHGGRMGLKTGWHFCKPNPVFFQEKVLLSYQNRLNELEKKWNERPVNNSTFFL